jgi:hypothetical protein
MEDNKNIKKNIVSDDLPRRPDGKIDITNISLGKSKRNNDIVPDDLFDKYYRELPDKVENASGSWRTVSTGGKIKIFGADPVADLEIQRAGANAVNAAKAQQRTFKEVIEEMLVNPASDKAIEELELRPDATNLDMIIAAALKQANKGNVKAMDFLRDTIGQKPTESINATVESITPEDKALLDRVAARLKNDNS